MSISRDLPIRLMVQEQVDTGIQLTADFPSLKGDPGSAFSYTFTITNNTPRARRSPSPPRAPRVDGDGVAEAEAKRQDRDSRRRRHEQVKVTATPPDTVDAGQYPIAVTGQRANGATGKISYRRGTGTPKLALATADQRLDVTGKAEQRETVSMVIANTGTAAVDDVKFAATAPTGWTVTFDPPEVNGVKPNETTQVIAVVKPPRTPSPAITRSVRASAGSQSWNVDLRYA